MGSNEWRPAAGLTLAAAVSSAVSLVFWPQMKRGENSYLPEHHPVDEPRVITRVGWLLLACLIHTSVSDRYEPTRSMAGVACNSPRDTDKQHPPHQQLARLCLSRGVARPVTADLDCQAQHGKGCCTVTGLWSTSCLWHYKTYYVLLTKNEKKNHEL